MRAGVTFVDKAATETLVAIALEEARLLNLYKQDTTDPEVLADELGPKRGGS